MTTGVRRTANSSGSTSLATDAQGGLVSRQLYTPYGEVRYAEGTLPTDYGFTGQRKDYYTQLYQMGARWYDPQIGRWISPDTIVPDPANPQSLNRYFYVLGNPLRYIDPTGHDDEPWWKRLINQWAPWTAPAIIDINGQRVSPPTSDDMTVWLIDQMKANADAEVTQRMRENWYGWPHQQAAALKAWTSLVRTGGVWDFKVDILKSMPNVSEITLGGRRLNYQAVANIHFGFVGRAAGFGGEVLRAGAGIAQMMDWGPSGSGPLIYIGDNMVYPAYFDEPFDTWCVGFGIYLYERHGDKLDELTPETFEQALQEFIETYGEPPPLE